ncbi:hypothetical protein [Candidatus Chloroploca asiatica]|uniref:Uncharacterized protein n=1 Tax=Candidatus Chloroploca asiatica TaxID=1506545 RepID=A0A2H3KLN9_9CHLR|nr:hypothetical protein [Candidatus Chloroploca asiatica]PDV98993.1 hypothetical protein A9Q02_14180 [Candidatus Chloroploca asiatica]
METTETATTIQLVGAGAFGVVIGWYIYFINRYRKGDVQLSDLVTLIGILGGGSILALFPARSDLFGAFGIGLAIGFFGYFIVLIFLVGTSKNFTVDWFLDGRRTLPDGKEGYPDDPDRRDRPMEGGASGTGGGPTPIN